MTESTTPIPAAVARDAIRRAIDNNFPHVAYKWSHLERATDAALEYLAAAGITIAGPGQRVIDDGSVPIAGDMADRFAVLLEGVNDFAEADYVRGLMRQYTALDTDGYTIAGPGMVAVSADDAEQVIRFLGDTAQGLMNRYLGRPSGQVQTTIDQLHQLRARFIAAVDASQDAEGGS